MTENENIATETTTNEQAVNNPIGGATEPCDDACQSCDSGADSTETTRQA